MNIYQYLKREHATQRHLANVILGLPPKSTRRFQLFMKFKRAWRRHAEIEASTLYSTLLRVPRAHMIARKGIEGHRDVANALNELEHHPINSETWLLKFEQLRNSLEEHQCEEEELLFAAAQRLFSDPEIDGQMTEQYEKARQSDRSPESPVTRLCLGKSRPLPRLEPDFQQPIVGVY